MPAAGEQFDAIVIGGGPGGSAAATLLAQAGRRVVVLERERFPRLHVGESLLPQSHRLLERLGVLDTINDTGRFITKYGAVFYDTTGELVQEYLFEDALGQAPPSAWQVERATFDHELLRNAAAAGADVREGWRAERVVFDGTRATGVDAVAPDGTRVALRGLLTIDASGRDTLLARQLGTRRPHPRLRKGALFAHFRGVPRDAGDKAGHIHIVQLDQGWAWVIPFASGLTSVGLVLHQRVFKSRGGASLESFFESVAHGQPVLKQMLAGAVREGPVHAMSNLSYSTDASAGPGWVLVGDAAAFLDPVFSTGVHLALLSAEMAADAAAPVLAHGRVPGAAHFEHYTNRMATVHRVLFPFVEGFYDPAFFHRFMRPIDRFWMRAFVTSLLSGEVFQPWPRVPLFWLFWLGVRRMRMTLAADGQPHVSTATD